MRRILDPRETADLRDLRFAIGQLRHAYTHLLAGRGANAEFANGLISPEIKRLERMVARWEALK